MNKIKDIMYSSVNKTTVKLKDGTEVQIRSMLVKEYKLLMMSNSTESGQIKTICEILENCILSDLDIRKIPAFDFELLFLELWKLSKGSTSNKVAFICQNSVTNDDGKDVKCGNKILHNVDLTKVTYSADVKSDIVKLTNDVSVKLRYPTAFETDYFDDTNKDDVFNLVMRCITHIIHGDEVMEVGKDIQESELNELTDYLDSTTFMKMAEHINNMPMLTYNFALKCTKCGNESGQSLIGLADFFD